MRRTDASAIADAAARRAREESAERWDAERKRRRVGVKTTQPIKSREMIDRWLRIAREHDARRPGGVSWYLLLVVGFNTGLRISDIVSLRVGDIRGHERLIKVARKTGKETNILIRPAARRVIDGLLSGRGAEEWLFPSQVPGPDGQPQPISRVRAYRIIREIARQAGYTDHVGCHTLRKTYAYTLYQVSGQDIGILQHQLGHSSSAVTLHYIGIDQEATDQAASKMPAFI